MGAGVDREAGKRRFARLRQLQGDAPAVRGGAPPADQALALQLLDQGRHRRFVAGDRSAEGDLGDAGIGVDHHHCGEAARLQIALAGMLHEAAEGGVLRQAQMERDEVPQRTEAYLRAFRSREATPSGHDPPERAP